ncbi:hypothetical protein HK097_000293 [Rhizophlyctis rosea]|uniref:F-box domain-containing protein n=1 Tax=Rhizophlyctis rosea TaxID=64517 RepID=A0AAD5X7N5_9FUNG|nr:hypothetical protein HK097_000293 [Rhizophlyctis rosea]
MRYSIYGTDAPEVLQYPDEAAFKSASLVCRAWNSAVRGEVDRKCHLSGMSRVFSRFLYETHSHTFSRRKTGLSDLHIDLSFGNARLPGSIVSIVEALAITSPLRNLHLSRVSIDSMRIVKLIAQCPALKHVGFSKCSFERGVDVEDHSVHLARQQLQQVTSAVIQGNSEWEWEEGDSFMKFLAGSLAPTLRSLVLSQQLHLTLDLPQLECLDFTLVPGSVALSSLPKLKHLRVEDNGSLKYVAPLTVDLHILEARMFWEMVEDYNDYYTALASLPALRVLDVEDFNRESPEALVPTEPHIAFYRRMGPSLRGFLIDVKSTHRPLLWCVGVHCRQLTHVGICCGSPEGPPLIGVDDITAFVRGCAKLRKVSVYGWNQDLVQEVAAALREVEGVDLLVGRTCPQVTSWWFS